MLLPELKLRHVFIIPHSQKEEEKEKPPKSNQVKKDVTTWMTVSKGHTLHALPCVSVVGLKYKYCNKNPITNMCVFPIQTLFGWRNQNFGRNLRPDVRPLPGAPPTGHMHAHTQYTVTRTHMSGNKNKHTG